MRFKFLLFILLSFGSGISLAQNTDCISLGNNFGHAVITNNISKTTQAYSSTQDYTGANIKLQSDIYTGKTNWNNQQLMQRPLLVLYHGGGFKSGARNVAIMQYIAQYFAQRAYVVVSADYRMGWEKSDQTQLCGGGSQKDYLDAQYRAMQDERALVQYYKSQANTLKFDTSRIFLFGISSGATLVVSRLEDEWIAQQDNRAQRLGPLEVFEGNRNYDTQVAGIISFAGANITPHISDDYHTPIAFFHGTCDNAVPYDEQYLASCSNLGYYYGPGVLTKELSQKNICYRNYIYCGYGHDLASTGDDKREIPWALQDVFDKSIDFMRSVMCEECSVTEEVANLNVAVQPAANCSKISNYELCNEIAAPESEKISLYPTLYSDDYRMFIHSNFDTNKKLILNIYNMNGELIQTELLQLLAGANILELQLNPLLRGTYFYQIIDGKKSYTSGKIWKM